VDRIVDFLLAEVNRRSRVDLSGNQIVRLRLGEAAQKAKVELLSATSTNVCVQYLEMGKDGPIHLDTTLTRAQLQAITGDAGVESLCVGRSC